MVAWLELTFSMSLNVDHVINQNVTILFVINICDEWYKVSYKELCM